MEVKIVIQKFRAENANFRQALDLICPPTALTKQRRANADDKEQRFNKNKKKGDQPQLRWRESKKKGKQKRNAKKL